MFGAQGGFIWDWVDQGLVHWVTNADGERVEAWGYGGDFGEPVHDAQFCINGLVFPDRTPHPACHECKAVMARARPPARALCERRAWKGGLRVHKSAVARARAPHSLSAAEWGCLNHKL